MTARNLIYAIYAFLIVLWPTATLAAATTFGASFEQVGWVSWLMVVVLSTVSGLTALLNRISQEIQRAEVSGSKIPALRVFIAANMLGSLLTGVFVFFICEHFDVPSFLEAASVIGGAYIGARLIERTMEGAVDRLLDKFGQILGIEPNGGYRSSRLSDRE